MTIDRNAEAARYFRYGKTTDRIARMGGMGRKYRGKFAHEWFTLARVARGMATH